VTLHVVRPGPQATLQGFARVGSRHLGIPASGPADPLSMALANRLAGNASADTAIEITQGGAEFEFRQASAFAIAGASGKLSLSGKTIVAHRTHFARQGDILSIGHPDTGFRTYLAVPGGFVADEFLGSSSTCLPAGFGGLEGRALRPGDELEFDAAMEPAASLETPANLRPFMTASHVLRCVPGPDYAVLDDAVWPDVFEITRRLDRTGIEIRGPWPHLADGALKPSAAVFPGAIQLTPSGNAFVLMPDAQTTGGYPHVLQVIRADRHLLGQVAPGDRIRFLRRTSEQAHNDLVAKTAIFADWLPGFRF